jgi:acyl carrier protein
LAFVGEQVVKVLGLSSSQMPGPNQGLIEIGMDSLMAVELSNRFRTNFHQSFSSTLAFEHTTIQALANYLNEAVLDQIAGENRALDETNSDARNGGEDDAAQLLSQLDDLSDEQVDALLRQMQTDQES